MSEITSNNKRIAKNTLLLYFRMLFTMVVSLYTSRVVLQALGVEDFGIYNVVGTFVAMFSVLSGSLSAAISRFITFELGTGDNKKLKKVFSSAVTIQIGLFLVIVLFAETLGLWFLNHKMVIPENRMLAANWVYQFSILTFGINLISVPYNAAIIAHERMSAFAYISILEVLGKLFVAFSITISPIDKLILYGFLLMLIALIIRIVYGYYCKKNFEECTFCFVFDRSLLREMFGFAGWNMIGSSASILRDQGGNVIINLFCGPSVNAARGIAIQVSHVVQGFVTNFMTALNPQIIKSYANGQKDYMMNLIGRGARFSFYLLFLLSLPIILSTREILHIWLGIVPEHTVSFIQLSLLFSLHETLAAPLVTAMLAHGDIKKYQIIAGGLNMLNLPISYFCLKMGMMPEFVFIVAILFSFLVQIARLLLLKQMIHLNIKLFFKEVYVNVLKVSVVTSIIPLILLYYFEPSFIRFIVVSIISFLCTLLNIYIFGCNKEEREIILSFISKFTKRAR